MAVALTLEGLLATLPKALPVIGAANAVIREGSQKIWFVDLALLHFDNFSDQKLYGNWRNTWPRACSDRNVNTYLLGNELKDYGFYQACPRVGSRGIWRFSLK